MKGRRAEHDIAHGCFLFCGLAALLGSLMEAIPKDEGSAALLGFFVAIPLVGISFIALFIGIVLSIRPPRPWSLVLLAGMSVLFVAGLFSGGGSGEIFTAYGVVVVTISGVWFLITRKRVTNARND